MAMKCVSSRASIVQRSRGQSVLATAAYQLHEKLKDDTTGQTFYFRPKVKGEVRYSRVYLCDGAPDAFANPEQLWNSVTKTENKSSKSQTAQLARNLRICLPQGLSLEEEIDLLDQFVAPLTKDGMIIQATIHDKGDGNPHIHLLMTMRRYKAGKWQAKSRKVYDLDSTGNRIPLIDPKTGKQKVDAKGRRQWKNHKEHLTEWNRKELLSEWRDSWASLCNEILPPDRQITAKSYAKQAEEGITVDYPRIPTRHEGYQARKIEAAGGVSEICEYNRIIRRTTKKLDRLQKEEQAASWQATIELAETYKKQRKINEQLTDIADRFRNGRRPGTGAALNDGDAGRVRTATIGKRRAAVQALRMGARKLLRILSVARGSGDRGETDRKELEAAIDDAGSRNEALRARLHQRVALRHAGREKRGDRRDARRL